MGRQATIVVAGGAGATEHFSRGLTPGGYDVRSWDDPVADPDLVLIDAGHSPDVIGAVRSSRDRWPALTTPVLVLGAGDAETSLAALQAGATNAPLAAAAEPLLTAHIHRAVRSGEKLRSLLARERSRATRDGLALAAADVARPLGDLVDKLELLMDNAPAYSLAVAALEDLLDQATLAVDAVDRLRELATAVDAPDSDHNA